MLYPQGPAGFHLKARSQSEDFRIRKDLLGQNSEMQTAQEVPGDMEDSRYLSPVRFIVDRSWCP